MTQEDHGITQTPDDSPQSCNVSRLSTGPPPSPRPLPSPSTAHARAGPILRGWREEEEQAAVRRAPIYRAESGPREAAAGIPSDQARPLRGQQRRPAAGRARARQPAPAPALPTQGRAGHRPPLSRVAFDQNQPSLIIKQPQSDPRAEVARKARGMTQRAVRGSITPARTIASPPARTIASPPARTIASPPARTIASPPARTIASPPADTSRRARAAAPASAKGQPPSRRWPRQRRPLPTPRLFVAGAEQRGDPRRARCGAAFMRP
eukprot:gene4849-biopygen5352